jgi:hypothetical protein
MVVSIGSRRRCLGRRSVITDPERALDRFNAQARPRQVVEQLQGEHADEARRCADDPIRWAGGGTWCAGVRGGKPAERGLRLLMGSISTPWIAR